MVITDCPDRSSKRAMLKASPRCWWLLITAYPFSFWHWRRSQVLSSLPPPSSDIAAWFVSFHPSLLSVWWPPASPVSCVRSYLHTYNTPLILHITHCFLSSTGEKKKDILYIFALFNIWHIWYLRTHWYNNLHNKETTVRSKEQSIQAEGIYNVVWW